MRAGSRSSGFEGGYEGVGFGEKPWSMNREGVEALTPTIGDSIPLSFKVFWRIVSLTAANARQCSSYLSLASN
jgi:hypothetical protein